MLKFLKGVVGSGGGIKDLPYNIGEPYSTAWGSWTHYRGTSKDDNSPVSIFSLVGISGQDGRLVAARNGAKRLRTVRHPNILSYIHSTEADHMEGGVTKQTIYVVTEPVVPLAEKIRELNLKGKQRDEFFAWGLHQVTKAVSFLNNDCNLVHGNICLDAVVVTPTLEWKLHALDVSSEFDGTNAAASGPMLLFDWLMGPQYKPQELVKADWSTIRKSAPWAIDSWGLGCLLYELFSGSKLTRGEELRHTEVIPLELVPAYLGLLDSNPSRRWPPARLTERSDFFPKNHTDRFQLVAMMEKEASSRNVEARQRADGVVRRRIEEPRDELIPFLPDEIALLCLARVPRASHHVLSAVCRSWYDLLHDKVFYDVRQELALVEEWLFLWTQDADKCNVWHGFDPKTTRWFELPPLPNEHRTACSSASAVVDGKLFVIGGQLSSDSACNFVSYFDMRHYCWKMAAPLSIARAKCMAGVIGNQLYVVGGFTERDQNAGATAEAYDPVTNKWRSISSMKIPMELYDSAVLGEKFYVVNSSSENLVGLVYDPQKDEWMDMANGLNTGWQSKTAALNGKLYAVGDSHSSEGKNEISVYNAAKDVWESIKGVLDDSAPVLSWGPELVSLGGRLCIVGTSSRAAVAMVEINEAAKPCVASLTFYDDITKKIQFAEPLPRGACQVLAL
ncbi:hypothetical protein R1flu_012657 [Riccia fluitans]|uniref:Protein kinase domain-containing protein n=1 Tax=Riccia fluitans TaxID=41844 RepID=A0ABD1ZBE4_9MARC